MEIASTFYLLLLVFATHKHISLGVILQHQDAKILTITRHNNGDFFTVDGNGCNDDTCVGLSSGTAGTPKDASIQATCTCQCHSHLPAFREDLQICVDDIHECVLSPFVSSSMSQQIPFVFLPLKGQIIHPSKEINFAGIQTPVCAVSGAKFLTDGGWIDLRNPVDTDVPFRLFRDEGRTFLQWVGEPDLRTRMGGRLVLVHLMCREIANGELPSSEIPNVFTPCVAFRVVGTPTKYLSNVSEVIFAPDAHASENIGGSGLSVSEYVAIGVCSVLLGLIYVASVFLYLHVCKKRKEAESMLERRGNQTMSSNEEGIIKNNPLLSLGRHFSNNDNAYSDSCSSDTDVTPDIIQHHDERKKNIQITSALIHPQHKYEQKFNALTQVQSIHQQETIERLPEENVSIVETLEGREDRPDSIKVIGTTRKKLYFNPAYFDPLLLMTPPPAAIEFLTKIREVISIAKQKMASKKFTPILNGIPEEEPNYLVDIGSEYSKAMGSRRGSMISLKRENSRRKTCSGCPGCEPQDFKALSGKLPEFPSIAACQNCSTTAESKQISIRKWLEDIPIVKSSSEEVASTTRATALKEQQLHKRLRSPSRSLSPDYITPHIRALSPRPASERARSPAVYDHTSSVKSGSSRGTVKTAKSIQKAKAPPPPLPPNPPRSKRPIQKEVVQNVYEVVKETKPLPPPDMIHEAMAVDTKADVPKIPTITKKKMNAVINQLSGLEQLKINSNQERQYCNYETDSLERSKNNKGYSTPSDYADMSSSQPSPSLSAALPMEEEMTMRNAIINKKTGNMTISKLNMQEVLQNDDNDYELIILKKGDHEKSNLFKLPELLQRSNGYSLVSEVYVNNGYNYGSAPSSPSESNCSTLEKAPKIIYEENNPGHLLIEVKDCPDNYIKSHDSDSYEPDTLDRKPKMNVFKLCAENEFVDSLERPNHILLRTTGSFKKDTMTDLVSKENNSNLNRNFGSLREIYEAKTKKLSKDDGSNWKVISDVDYEGRILTLEERHCRRQRRSPVSMPPDVIPPNNYEIESPLYEHPKPPRMVKEGVGVVKPPLPPKNGSVRSTEKITPDASNSSKSSDYDSVNRRKHSDVSILQNFIHTEDILFKNGINNQLILQARTITTKPIDLSKSPGFKAPQKTVFSNKPDDSGYLSTDSNDSKKRCLERRSIGSETDDSVCDAHSESGAESIETHSVFFGSYRKSSCLAGSIDSGVGSELKLTETVNTLEDINSSDSETMSYNTVVPFNDDK